MHRIDGPSAAPGGFFTEGDPTLGTPSTIVTDDWTNAVQEEVCGVVEGAGLALSKPNNAQLLAAILALLAARLPAGAVQAFAMSTAPTGWLKCNGALINRAAYPTLWAAIGTTYGAGDGSTTFALPDLRGEFLRGWDDGRNVDTGRAMGSGQAGMTEAHKHVVPWGESTGGTLFGRTANAGKFGTETNDSDNYWYHSNDGSNYDGTVNAAGVIGAETRPRNIAVLWCIRT